MATEQPDGNLEEELERALLHLYDPEVLRKSPLVALLGLDDRRGQSGLRQTLLAAVDALKPQGDISQQGQAWRTFRVLYHRYVAQFTQSDVAQTLGLSTRQVSREETRSLQVLADYLRSMRSERSANAPATGAPPAQMAAGEETSPSEAEELQWLERSSPHEVASIAEIIGSALKTVQPLLQAHDVVIVTDIPDGLPHVAGPSGAIRQALLALLTAAIPAGQSGSMEAGVQVQGEKVEVLLQPWPLAESSEALTMAQRLLDLAGGKLETRKAPDGQHTQARLLFPAAEQMAVLVIDDNADVLQLFQRSLAGTRYPFVGCRDPHQALQLAVQVSPRIIVLDVMLPGMDGWELLHLLREDPATRGTALVVCSILPQEHLALAMGAAAYLRKPVSRATLLATLDRLAGRLGQE
jgi:CheY-like chemotaxis protein